MTITEMLDVELQKLIQVAGIVPVSKKDLFDRLSPEVKNRIGFGKKTVAVAAAVPVLETHLSDTFKIICSGTAKTPKFAIVRNVSPETMLQELADTITAVFHKENNGFSVPVKTMFGKLPPSVLGNLTALLRPKTKITEAAFVKFCKENLAEHFVHGKQGTTAVFRKILPPKDLVLHLLRTSSPVSATILKGCGMTQTVLAEILNQLSSSGQIRVELDKSLKLAKIFTVHSSISTATAAVHPVTSGTSPSIKPSVTPTVTPLATPSVSTTVSSDRFQREMQWDTPEATRKTPLNPPNTPSSVSQFKAAYDKHQRGGLFARICDLRQELGWDKERFETVLKELRDKRIIQLLPGDTHQMTQSEVQESFFAENHMLYLNLAWNQS